MSGQSAALSLKEARAMQERVQCGTNHSSTHGGSGGGMQASHSGSGKKSKMHSNKEVVQMEKHEE